MPEPDHALTITLSIGSAAYQKHLAVTLQGKAMLRRILSFGPDLEIFDPRGNGDLELLRRYSYCRLGSRVLWGIWRRLPGSRYSRNLPIVASTFAIDRTASRWVPPSTIFHGRTGICLASLRAAKHHGAVTLIENAIMHPRDWQKAVLEECDAFGVHPHDCRAVVPLPLIRRMEREYELCDSILVPSSVARQSFVARGHAEKTIVVTHCVDHHLFHPLSPPATGALFRVCYVGRIELVKGVPYLLQAWKQLNLAKAELLLIGEIAPEMTPLLKQYATPNVRLTGMLPQAQVAHLYRTSSLFAFPSVNEGLARVLLEAMASGLPVVATTNSGAEDCVTPGVDGTIVAARNAAALAQAILWHYQNTEASAAMGTAARAKIEQRFTQSHYEDRMLALYRSVTAKSHPVPPN